MDNYTQTGVYVVRGAVTNFPNVTSTVYGVLVVLQTPYYIHQVYFPNYGAAMIVRRVWYGGEWHDWNYINRTG